MNTGRVYNDKVICEADLDFRQLFDEGFARKKTMASVGIRNLLIQILTKFWGMVR